jgi:hypothetical protein
MLLFIKRGFMDHFDHFSSQFFTCQAADFVPLAPKAAGRLSLGELLQRRFKY